MYTSFKQILYLQMTWSMPTIFWTFKNKNQNQFVEKIAYVLDIFSQFENEANSRWYSCKEGT